jgi:hypothetical protein
MRKTLLAASAATALALAAAASAQTSKQPQQVVTGPEAVYWVSATTGSGLMAMMGGQGDGGMMAGMRMARQMMAGGPSHQLSLDLGSSRAPTGAPQGTHTPPPALGVRGALPLETPRPGTPVERRETRDEPERPRGRLLLFWGCGERARAGQPVIIDFARIAAGQMPPGLSSVTVNAPNPPSTRSHRTYGGWPNSQRPNGDAAIGAGASLLGEHVVRSSYAPDIRFTPTQDFMPPLNFTTNARMPSGAVNLVWTPVAGATGYAGWTFGAKGEDLVFWSTSEAKAFGAYAEFIPPGEAARLVRERALLAPATTQCAVPAEVMTAMGAGAGTAPDERGGGMLFFTAYGPEENLVHPERPADPRVAWNREWTVKVRHRSATMQMLGQPMGGATGPDGRTAQNTPACPPSQPSGGSAVGSAIGAATGIPGAGAVGGALGRAFGKKKQDAPPADPACPPGR